jgi:hypothetical protein
MGIEKNEGLAFAQFHTSEEAEYFIEDFEYFKKLTGIDKRMQVIWVDSWELKIAPPSNDIIWEYFSNRHTKRKTLIRAILWTLLIMISIVLVTPLTILDNLNPIIQLIETYLGGMVYVKTYFQLFLTPFCLYLFNYVLIPILISFLINFEQRSRKSHNAKTRLRKNFFFFILNQIMLPLAGFSTIYSFFEYLAKQDLTDWPETLASKMSPSGSFFLRYIIQISLLSNTFQLLSLPKIFYDFFSNHTWTCKRIKKTKNDISMDANYL